MPFERKTIIKRFLLLCEGRDAEIFLIAFLNSDELHDDARFSEEIQVLDFGGNDELNSFLGTLKNMDGFSEVTSIVVLRDAETSFEKSNGEVVRALKQNGLPCPEKCGSWAASENMPYVGYELFPLDGGTGTLEDLCLSILKENKRDEIIHAIDSFLETIKRIMEEIIDGFTKTSFTHTFQRATATNRCFWGWPQKQVPLCGIVPKWGTCGTF